MAVHKRQHLDFVKRFGELKAEFDEHGATADTSINLNRFICGWLREHIGTTDTALGKHLKAVGAREAA